MYAADGRFCGYRGTGRDVTQRKEFETQLALKSFALDHIHEQAHLFDADQQIIYVNEESCRALGYRREELKAMSIFDFDPDITIDQFAELQGRLRVAGHATFESRHRRKDGSTLPVEIDLSVFAFDGRDFVLTLAKDITERRRQEEELRRHRDHLQEMVAAQTDGLLRAKDEAQQANRAKSEFLANVTHELRTPMHAILSYANLGRDRQGQVAVDKLASYFDHIRDSGERLLVLIDELLDLSKLEAGCMLLERRPLQAADLCRDVVRDLTPLWSARQQHIELRSSDGIGVIQADPDRVAQVLRNLLANAIRFSPDGSEITVSLMPAALPGRRADDHGSIPALRIAVADLGVGIPEAELEAIFDAFVQSSRTRTGAGGTGLGLAICRQVVHAHHGRIQAQNRPEGGAEFEVLLPTH
jgi:PAS domain S-box-containing protein